MPTITDPANPTPNFGQTFNYGAWPKNTTVDLCNVPWNNDYRDIVKFNNLAALNTYIDGLETAGISIDRLSYVKPNQPVRVNIPFNRAYKFNYLRARNPIQPIPGNDVQRDYFYFITDVRYISPNTTELVLQLDIWQTFSFDMQFGNCYIERGHIGIANQNNFSGYGRDYLTIPEGLDIGSEYQVLGKRSKQIMAWDGTNYNESKYNVLVVSTTDLEADAGTVGNPKLKTAEGGAFFTLPSGANYYVFEDYIALQNVMGALAETPWITQGIISITAIPVIKRYLPGYTFNAAGFAKAPEQLLPPLRYALATNWRNASEIINHIPARYRGLKKLWTFPYMMIELTMFTGTALLIKPESWNDDNGTVIERFSPAPPNQRVVVSPYKYNAANSDTDDLIPGLPAGHPLRGLVGGDDNGEYVDMSTQMNNFPAFAIVNNGAIAYMAANAHGIHYQYQDSGWQQQRALRGNEVSYDQASSGMNLANEITGIGIKADTQSVGIGNDIAIQKAVLGGVSSIVGGAAGGVGGGAAGVAAGAAGGVLSAAAQGISAGIDINSNNQQLAVRNAAASASNRAQVGNQGFVRDTNKNLADWAANGDYENKIAGINAKVQDIKLTQPSTSGQVGGEALNILMNNAFISMRFKMVDQSAIRIVGEYWLRYGYAVRQFAQLPSNLMVMTKFTYWKLSETYIRSSAMPESFKQVIRGIFEKGVTVWANPNDIGIIDIADNAPLGGITL